MPAVKMEFFADTDGRIFALPALAKQSPKLRVATDAEIAAWVRHRAKPAGSPELLTLDEAKRRVLKPTTKPTTTTKATKPCGGCKQTAAPLVRWAGVWWIGVPWPKRLRFGRRFPWVYVQGLPGCGCLHRIKREGELARLYWTLWRQAVARRLESDRGTGRKLTARLARPAGRG